MLHAVFLLETSSKSARGHRMILRLDFLLSVVEEEEEVVPIKNKLHLPDKENHNNGR